MSDAPPVEVALALVWRDGRLLISRRLAHVHLGGCWELPGGKCHPGEEPAGCAVREVREELGIDVEVVRARRPLEHEYPGRRVRLHPFDCSYLGGEPRPHASACLRWVAVDELPRYEFPAANAPLLDDLAREGPPGPATPGGRA